MPESDKNPIIRDPARLAAVSNSLRFDTSARNTFDRLVRLAARTLRAPVAQVNLVSGDRQISVASIGPGAWAGPQEVALESSYCQQVVRSGEPLLVRDARHDPRVRDNRATAESKIISYAAVPLTVAGDLVVGTLCVVDFSPRDWTPDEVEALEALSEFVITEIQRRGHTEAELLHLTAVLDSSQDSVVGIDLQGTITTWSAGAERMLGYSSSAAIGRPVMELFAPRHRAPAAETLERMAAGEVVQRLDTEQVRQDGSRVSVSVVLTPVHDIAGRMIGATAVFRDITSRVKMANALQESEARFRALIEHSQEIITVVAVDGTIKYESPAVGSVLGYSPGAQVGQNAFAFVHPDDLPRVKETFAYAVEEALPTTTEFRVRHADGSYRVLSAVGMTMLADVAVSGVVVNSRDVTELRQGEERLRQSQKMEAVGRLAGGIAHDFNNILLVIKGRSQLAMMDLDHDSAVRDDIAEIDHAADRAANLTRQLLAFSRQQVLQAEVLDLNQIVREMERLLRRSLGEDIEFVTDLDPELGKIEADPGQIEQILMNLAVNARDAMPLGGKLITETKNFESNHARDDHPGESVPPGSYVLLCVCDTGTGMTKEVRQRVFDPFFTTKPLGQGTGLGLSTVYGIVDQSGGFISLDTVQGEGTTFRIYLPRVDAPGQRSDPASPSLPHRRQGTILLVEDESAVRSTARRLLDRLGHRVIEASNGEEALRVYSENSETIDLLLTDVVMPLMGGVELAENLRRLQPDLKVLYTSGYTDEAIVRHGIRDGYSAFLQKPYELASLQARVSEMLDGGSAG